MDKKSILSMCMNDVEQNPFTEPNTGDEETDRMVEQMRNDPNDIEVAFRRFHMEYRKFTEDKLDVRDGELTVKLRKAYCPSCGSEIVSQVPVIMNHALNERIGRYECPSCGEKLNLDHAYPRVVFFDKDGNEITPHID